MLRNSLQMVMLGIWVVAGCGFLLLGQTAAANPDQPAAMPESRANLFAFVAFALAGWNLFRIVSRTRSRAKSDTSFADTIRARRETRPQPHETPAVVNPEFRFDEPASAKPS